jgi:hypothetical protein
MFNINLQLLFTKLVTLPCDNVICNCKGGIYIRQNINSVKYEHLYIIPIPRFIPLITLLPPLSLMAQSQLGVTQNMETWVFVGIKNIIHQLKKYLSW